MSTAIPSLGQPLGGRRILVKQAQLTSSHFVAWQFQVGFKKKHTHTHTISQESPLPVSAVLREKNVSLLELWRI